jgi:uncharacterized damage-inducible protein DinB
MLKRTKGYILLTLLVVTGLAGTLSNTTLTKKERKFAAGFLKDTKSDLLKSVKGLSEEQLNFKPAADQWSVKECVQHLALSEEALWGLLQSGMQQAANPEKRSELSFTDEQFIKMISSRERKVKTMEAFYPEKSKWKTMDETVEAFKKKRADLTEYVKTTTEDLRNHVMQAPMGMIDGYQVLLLIAAHTTRHTAQINEVKADPKFPKQ